MALLVRGARVAGPRGHGGRLLLQTFLPRHEVVQAALLADPGRILESERARRERTRPASVRRARRGERRRRRRGRGRAATGRRDHGGRRARLVDGAAPTRGRFSVERCSAAPLDRRVPASGSRSTLSGAERRGGGSPSTTRGGSSASPASVSQRCRESAPRCFWTTRTARPSGASRSSQRTSRSCSAGLPMRIGGFDQIRPEPHVVGHVVGRHDRHVVDAVGRRVRRAQRTRPLVDVDRPHPSRRARGGRAPGRSPRSRSRGRARRRRGGGGGAERRSSAVPASRRPWLKTPRSVRTAERRVGQRRPSRSPPPTAHPPSRRSSATCHR